MSNQRYNTGSWRQKVPVFYGQYPHLEVMMSTNILNSIDPRELGKELQAARKSRGMTQDEAAQIIAVTRTTITAIEKGERRIKASELMQLAQAYGRQISDFVRPHPSLNLANIRLRGPAQFTENEHSELERVVDDAREDARNYLELEQLMNAPLTRKYPPEYPIAGIPASQAAETIAIQERNRLGLGDGPLQGLRDILEQEVGVRVFYLPLHPSTVSGLYFYAEPIGACIGINALHPEERRLWSLAHDYGHFLIARHKPIVSFADTVYQRVPEEERLVDAFAMVFTMPTSSVMRRVNGIKQFAGRITPTDLLVQANSYGVSVEAFTGRLEDLKLLPTGTWGHLIERGFKVREAQVKLDIVPAPEQNQRFSRRYQLLAVSAFNNGRITEGQLARFLRVDRLEARLVVETLQQQIPESLDTNDAQLDAAVQEAPTR
jgi:Zn-dependent peptidase ImmA (M78 family)/DNA-binding XRE family transcriptional regulator